MKHCMNKISIYQKLAYVALQLFDTTNGLQKEIIFFNETFTSILIHNN